MRRLPIRRKSRIARATLDGFVSARPDAPLPRRSRLWSCPHAAREDFGVAACMIRSFSPITTKRAPWISRSAFSIRCCQAAKEAGGGFGGGVLLARPILWEWRLPSRLSIAFQIIGIGAHQAGHLGPPRAPTDLFGGSFRRTTQGRPRLRGRPWLAHNAATLHRPAMRRRNSRRDRRRPDRAFLQDFLMRASNRGGKTKNQARCGHRSPAR